MSNNFMCAAVSDGVSGQRSFVQLWNPSNSGIMVSVTNMIIAQSAGSSSGYDLRMHTVANGSFRSNATNKLLNGPVSVSQVNCGVVLGANIGGTILQEEWSSSSFSDKTYPFNPPIQIPPGYGIQITPSADSSYMIASFEFSESSL